MLTARLGEPLFNLLLVPNELLVHSLVDAAILARFIWVQLLCFFNLNSLLMGGISYDNVRWWLRM